MLTKATLSSEWIYKFYKELENHGIENHGLLIMKDGETVFEEYAYPYSGDMPHTLFSVTKSIVATAAGFAVDEGLFLWIQKFCRSSPNMSIAKAMNGIILLSVQF